MASAAPFADPLSHTRGHSPYYDVSHVRLRNEVREYIDKHIAPFCEEWEEKGAVPREVATSSTPLTLCNNSNHPSL